jgi:hypothetical protein
VGPTEEHTGHLESEGAQIASGVNPALISRLKAEDRRAMDYLISHKCGEMYTAGIKPEDAFE